MTLLKLLKEEGWLISSDGLEILGLSDDSNDVQSAVKKILDYDLREIGALAFPEDFCKVGNRLETLEYPVCVQLQKIRNISAPKANEESRAAPRMLKFTFTDGVITYQGVEVEYLSGLSVNTPPGTKVMIKPGSIKAAHNILLLVPENVKVLGGVVAHLVEKWELNRSLAKHTRGGGENAPPPWIPFGQPLESVGPQDKSFKSLQEGPKLDNVEFEVQRKGAIAEAQKLSGVKKVFGGGTKPMLDANVQKIVDAGFTEEQAESTLKVTRNNADRALKILQKKENATENKKEKNKASSENKGGRKGRGKEGDEEGGTTVKPSGKVSLFDFLEDKLPALPEPEKPVKNSEPQPHYRDERRGRGGGRGGYRGGGSGAGRQNNYQSNNKHDSTHHTTQQHISTSGNIDNISHGNKRDDRHNMQHEKAPRFQKKYENDTRRQQQNQNSSTPHDNVNVYHSGYAQQQQQQQQPAQQAYYGSERRNVSDNRSTSRTFYGQQSVDSLTDATAAMNIQTQSNPQSRVFNNSRPNNVSQPYPNQNYTYPGKPMYNNHNSYLESYKRNSQYVNSNKQHQVQPIIPNGQQQQMHQQSFYAPYPETQMKMQQDTMRQTEIMEPFRQNPMQDQRNNYNNRGNGFYQNNKLLPYQNSNVNDQARKMVNDVGEIHWNIGDRCLAKYWEDNGFYDAEITGVSARTVVVRFLAYGNHEEVLKSDCLPPSTIPAIHAFNANPNPMMREQSRPARFHQPMYVPPAQRKA